MGQKKSKNISGICERLAQIRLEIAGPRGKSSFAKMLGISASTYDYYESGRIPPVDIVVKIAEVANVDLYWLLTGQASQNTPGYDNPIVRRAVRLLKDYPQATQQLSAFLDILSDTLKLGEDQPAKQPAQPDKPEYIDTTCPGLWIPILGRSAAGISHFWSNEDDTKDLTTMSDLVDKYIDSLKEHNVTSATDAKSFSPKPSEAVQLITLKTPLDPSQCVEFISSPRLRHKYTDALAMRIDGDSMSPEILHGDIVVVSPSIKASAGDVAVIQLENAIGVTCKLYHPAGKKVNLVAINEKYAPQQQNISDVNWALKVVAKIRPGVV